MPRSMCSLLSSGLNGCETVLDVGCGSRSMLFRLGVGKVKVTGLDIWEPYSRNASAGLYDAFIVADIQEAQIRPKSFDLVLMTYLLEHLSPDQALHALNKAEMIAKRRVVIVVPVGRVHSEAVDGNPYQLHKSVWSAEKLRTLGYRVKELYQLRRRWYGLKFGRTAFAVKNLSN